MFISHLRHDSVAPRTGRRKTALVPLALILFGVWRFSHVAVHQYTFLDVYFEGLSICEPGSFSTNFVSNGKAMALYASA